MMYLRKRGANSLEIQPVCCIHEQVTWSNAFDCPCEWGESAAFETALMGTQSTRHYSTVLQFRLKPLWSSPTAVVQISKDNM